MINLNENIDQFLNDIKQLNIDTFDLIKHTSSNKSNIEPINLYKKIAFGSLDLYVLHPTALMMEDDKALSILQKVIRKKFDRKIIKKEFYFPVDTNS